MSLKSDAERELIARDVDAYLDKHQGKELLRFVAVGSVDDGKSTLIGRLLHDTSGVYEDQLEAVKRASNMEGAEIDFSLITDGLKAEREQGITIDVAYRYFSTDDRKYIIADTPGHVQYTRNMVTGASTANVAIILIDARLGVLEQSRRHGFIASLLGIPHLLVAVNKMDLRDYDKQVFDDIRSEFSAFAKDMRFRDVAFIPISALRGENVVDRGDEAMPWYDGPTVLDYLEQVPVEHDINLEDFRYPVQYVLRPNLDYRGFAGQIASGRIKVGDDIVVLPSGKSSRVKAIDTYDGPVDQAHAPLSVTIRLEDEVDVSRGDMLVRPNNLPRVDRSINAHVVWMNETPLDVDKTYLLKHTTRSGRVQIDDVQARIDLHTLEDEPADTLYLNDIGKLRLTCHRALYFDAYEKNRGTGAFILVDSLSNATVAAGMIIDDRQTQALDEALAEVRAGSGLTPKTQVSSRERRERFGQTGCTVWLTGLPGSGRWALAYALERRLFDEGRTAHVVDPTGESLRCMASAAKAATMAGLVSICAFPSYTETDRAVVRNHVGSERFIQVFVDTAEALCRERRPDADFSGFEAPAEPALRVALDQVRVEQAVDQIIEVLRERGQFEEL